MAEKQSFNLKASVPTQQDEAALSRPSAGTSASPTVSPVKPASLRGASKPPFHRTTLNFNQKLSLKDFLTQSLLIRPSPDTNGHTHYYPATLSDSHIAASASENFGFPITKNIVHKMRISLFGALAINPLHDKPNKPNKLPPLSDFESRLIDLENEIELLKTEIHNLNKFMRAHSTGNH